MHQVTFGSVCSGIGAPEVAWAPLGWQCVWQAEIENNPSRILAHHWPTVANLGDMTALPGYVRAGWIAAPDILVGGTPCQAYSIAGLRGGMTDPRGQLTLTFVDLANAIDEQRTAGDECVVVWENVPGVLSSADNAFGYFLAGLAGESDPLVSPGGKWANAGVVIGPQRAIAWRIVDAQFFGVAQRRRRVLVVASARNGFDPAAILFEFGSVRRDSPPRRGQGEETTGTLTNSIGVRRGTPGYLQPVAKTLTAGGHSNNPLDENLVPVCFTDSRGDSRGSGVQVTGDIANTLHCAKGISEQQIVAYGFQPRIARNGRGDMGELCHPLTAQAGETGKGDAAPHVAYAIQAGALRTNPASGPDGMGVQADHAYTLEARAEVQAVAYQPAPPGVVWRVRRLTPTECERLQGFPTVKETVIVDVCSDPLKNYARAALQCHRSLTNAWPAVENESMPSVSVAALNSNTPPADHVPRVVLRVLTHSGGDHLQILSQEKCLWSANSAPACDMYPRSTPNVAIAAELARLSRELAHLVRCGAAGSPANALHFQVANFGVTNALKSGDASAACASVVTNDAKPAKSTTSKRTPPIPLVGSTQATLLCSVLAAINSCIPNETLAANFSLRIDIETQYTAIPGMKDGPRYKALGNSMCVFKMRWLGMRIAPYVDAAVNKGLLLPKFNQAQP